VVSHRWYTLSRIIDADGAVGIGFCYAGSDGGALSTMAIRELFAPLLTGRESHATVGLWDTMYRQSILHGRVGSVMRALSAVDIALWDLNARRAGLPLHLYLGGSGVATVPAYASGGYYLEGKGVDGLVSEVEHYVEMGFDAVKIKVGRASIREDNDRIAGARAVLGTDRLLMLDANNAWSHVAEAIQAIRAWEKHDPYGSRSPSHRTT
jgi:L-alanine-DL-glutamate epimerase-like enolase superfamily enzyme